MWVNVLKIASLEIHTSSQQRPNILSKSADAELVVGENIAYREIRNYRLGEMTLIYRVLKATKKDIGSDDSEEVLRDSQGREISLIEGVIVMGFQPDVR